MHQIRLVLVAVLTAMLAVPAVTLAVNTTMPLHPVPIVAAAEERAPVAMPGGGANLQGTEAAPVPMPGGGANPQGTETPPPPPAATIPGMPTGTTNPLPGPDPCFPVNTSPRVCPSGGP